MANSRLIAFTLTLLCVLCAAQTASAGETISKHSKQDADAPSEFNRLFKSWRGLQPYLQNHGVNLGVNLVTETAAVLAGGKSRGVEPAYQFGFTNDIDWEKLANVPGFSTHALLISRGGHSVTNRRLVGDKNNLWQLQDIYGSFDVAFKLAYFYAEQKLFSDHVSLAAGRMAVQNSFDNSKLYCNFMTGAICGDPRAISSMPGVTPFPVSTWGARVKIQPTPTYYVKFGAYEVNPHLGGRSGFNWTVDDANGVTFPLEFGITPKFGVKHLTGHYKFGVIHSTVDSPVFLDPGHTSNSTAVYFLADQLLGRHGEGEYNGVNLLAGYVHTFQNVSQQEDFAFLGMVDQGIIASRPEDKLSMQVTYARVNNRLSRQQRNEQQTGTPLSLNANGVQGHQLITELNYNIRAYRGVRIVPDVQYIHRPSATSTNPDAFVVGLKTAFNF